MEKEFAEEVKGDVNMEDKEAAQTGFKDITMTLRRNTKSKAGTL